MRNMLAELMVAFAVVGLVNILIAIALGLLSLVARPRGVQLIPVSPVITSEQIERALRGEPVEVLPPPGEGRAWDIR